MFNKCKELEKVKRTLERTRDSVEDVTEGKYNSSFQEIIDDVELELETLKDMLKEHE
jgi:hypothetical protein